MLNFLKKLFGLFSSGDLLETAKEKLNDGSLNEVLEKVGIDADKLEDFTEMASGAIGMASKALRKDDDEEAESDDEDFDEEEDAEDEEEEEEPEEGEDAADDEEDAETDDEND